MISSGKHIIEEFGGTRCTVVETACSKSRVDFLKSLLELNKLEVCISEDKAPNADSEKTYTIGVTSLIFNPTIAIYERKLFTDKGQHVTPAYWKQYTTVCNPNYWRKHI